MTEKKGSTLQIHFGGIVEDGKLDAHYNHNSEDVSERFVVIEVTSPDGRRSYSIFADPERIPQLILRLEFALSQHRAKQIAQQAAEDEDQEPLTTRTMRDELAEVGMSQADFL